MPPDHCPHCPCSHGETSQRLASASLNAGAWLLIEHPGPWAGKLDDTALAPPVARVLARARAHHVRVQLIRRPGRRRHPTPPIQVYTAWSGEDPWLEGRELAGPAELGGLDLRAVVAGVRPEFGAPVPHLFLVCANAKHNVCCARLGAPLARALYDGLGDVVWETTHLGGDRFAANLVCLPHGLYYGDLALVDGFVAAGRYMRGEVWLKRYRGRAGAARAAQAAEHFLRAQTGDLGVDGLVIESVSDEPAAAGTAAAGTAAAGTGSGETGSGGTGSGVSVSEVLVRLGGERYRVCVERVPSDPCGPDCEANPETFVLKDLTRA